MYFKRAYFLRSKSFNRVILKGKGFLGFKVLRDSNNFNEKRVSQHSVKLSNIFSRMLNSETIEHFSKIYGDKSINGHRLWEFKFNIVSNFSKFIRKFLVLFFQILSKLTYVFYSFLNRGSRIFLHQFHLTSGLVFQLENDFIFHLLISYSSKKLINLFAWSKEHYFFVSLIDFWMVVVLRNNVYHLLRKSLMIKFLRLIRLFKILCLLAYGT